MLRALNCFKGFQAFGLGNLRQTSARKQDPLIAQVFF